MLESIYILQKEASCNQLQKVMIVFTNRLLAYKYVRSDHLVSVCT